MTPQQTEHHDGEPGDRRPHRAEVAALPLPVRGRPAAADDRPAEHAHVAATAPTCSTTRPTTASRPTKLMTLLDEMLERPRHQGGRLQPVAADARAARAAARRNEAGTTSSSTAACRARKRKDLIDRFRDDPKCRLFLSTDAGGVGLNLQHASVVVNMDLPWNPAVLEQRIGRVHRLGQKRPVRVVNFVAQGTIEEGMLVGAEVQEVAVRRRAGRRREGGLPGRHAG